MNKSVVLTGIRSNVEPQIGNYFGAILPLVNMAKKKSNDCQVNIFVPDLHSFTTPIDYTKLYEQTMRNLAIFVAAGLPLDLDNVYLYRQSFVPAHSELTVILNNFTGFGEMSRMTQFKDKSSKLENDRVSVGLFDYPVLMAADILIYGASYIPVGDDQTQHIEFTRDIAQRMNAKFGDIFVVPKSVEQQHAFFENDQGLRIMDLNKPTNKMSKSDESGKGVVFLLDDPQDAAKKVLSATTDSVGNIAYDKVNQPGISNLLLLLSLLHSKPLKDVLAQYEGKSQYGELKQAVADALVTFLSDFQKRLDNVDHPRIEKKLIESERAMNKQANNTLYKVQQVVGLRKNT